MPNNSVYAFTALITGLANGFADQAAFKIEGSIVRGANAAATALLGVPTVTALGASAGAAAWTAVALADAVNGGLVFQVVGAAATTIKWSGRVDTAENVN
jgi:hypothetical protein